MNNIINNSFNSERSVESVFVHESIKKYYKSNDIVLDVGGVPTNTKVLENYYNYLIDNKIDYRISDFRPPCHYPGDFVKYDFNDEKFDIIIFLSSLEHFPQCTESDLVFRNGYDKMGFKKALSILNSNGFIILTVPFGKHIWQKYHQNYDYSGILELTEGSKIIEEYIYRLVDDKWILSKPETMNDVIYTDRAFGVGCFVLQKI
jgi:hypothetical protein